MSIQPARVVRIVCSRRILSERVVFEHLLHLFHPHRAAAAGTPAQFQVRRLVATAAIPALHDQARLVEQILPDIPDHFHPAIAHDKRPSLVRRVHLQHHHVARFDALRAQTGRVVQAARDLSLFVGREP